MPTFTLKNPTKLGERDAKYGQTWWSYIHEKSTPIMFNLMEDEVTDGQKVSCEEYTVKEGKKGEYLRLKKVQPQGSTPKSNGSGNGSRQFAKDDNAIRAQFAIKAAVAWANGHPDMKYTDLEKLAKELYAMVDRIKGSDEKKAVVSESLPPLEAYSDAPTDEELEEEVNLDGIPF